MRLTAPAGLLLLLVTIAAVPAGAARGPVAASAQAPVPPSVTTDPAAPTAPAADPAVGLRASERIARRYGPRRLRLSFLVSTDGIPESVGSERFVAMAETQGARWGLRPDGVTFDKVSLRNRRSEVGFSTRVPDGLLGISLTRTLVRYRRYVRCRLGPDGSRSGCVTTGVKKVGTTVTDRDVLLQSDVPWEPGPAWPEATEFDLQTVLIHELGHFAGNQRHDANCTVAPMTPSLSPGDWWRSTLDHRVVCRSGARAASAGPAPMGFGHRDVVERAYETRIVGERRGG